MAQRRCDDPHVWATALYDEVGALGFERSYQRFTHALRTRGLRPHCEPCAGVRGRPTIEIAHPPGEEIQWDFLELPGPSGMLHLLVGTLSHSGRWVSEPSAVTGACPTMATTGWWSSLAS